MRESKSEREIEKERKKERKKEQSVTKPKPLCVLRKPVSETQRERGEIDREREREL